MNEDDKIPDELKNFFDSLSEMFTNMMNNVSANDLGGTFGFSIKLGGDDMPTFTTENIIQPAVDIFEHNEYYEIILEIVGVTDTSQVHVEVSENNCIITALAADGTHYECPLQLAKKLSSKYEIDVKNRLVLVKLSKS